MKVAFLGQGPFAIPIRQKLIETFDMVAPDQSDVSVVASWGKILTSKEINRPKYGILNIHPSLLPKYRGATPVQWAILNNDIKTGVTIIKMDARVDHGPILAQSEVTIAKNDSYDTLTKKLATVGAEMIIGLLPQYIAGKVQPIEQDHSKASYVYRFKKEDGLLHAQDPAELNERKIRALWPWPGTYIDLPAASHFERSEKPPKKLFIHQAHVDNSRLILDLVQLEGRKRMSFDEFRRGWRGNL